MIKIFKTQWVIQRVLNMWRCAGGSNAHWSIRTDTEITFCLHSNITSMCAIYRRLWIPNLYFHYPISPRTAARCFQMCTFIPLRMHAYCIRIVGRLGMQEWIKPFLQLALLSMRISIPSFHSTVSSGGSLLLAGCSFPYMNMCAARRFFPAKQLPWRSQTRVVKCVFDERHDVSTQRRIEEAYKFL